MTLPILPDLWMPPVEGVKALADRRPSERSLRAQTQSAVVLQRRYERWITWHYSRIFADMRRAFEGLDHIPDQMEIAAILAGFEQRQRDVLQRMFLQVYPQAVAMVMPDDRVKSYRCSLEVKALSPEQERILEQIRQSLDSSVSSMSAVTMRMLLELRDSAIRAEPFTLTVDFFPQQTEISPTGKTDIERFIESLESSGAFSPSRARMIAVTETNEAVNVALHQAAQEAVPDEPLVKTWSTWQDSLVRPNHRVMHDVTIPADELFRVPNRHGGYDLMMRAGDRSNGAGPENFINCRCKTFEHVE